jgi:hypothetical protein
VKHNKPTPDWGPALRENRTGRYARDQTHNDDVEGKEMLEIIDADDQLVPDDPFTISKVLPALVLCSDDGIDNKAFLDDEVLPVKQMSLIGDVPLRRTTSNSSDGRCSHSNQSSTHF